MIEYLTCPDCGEFVESIAPVSVDPHPEWEHGQDGYCRNCHAELVVWADGETAHLELA